MKTDIKKLQLVEKGLSAKTVAKLNESQINVLYSKLLNEQPQPQQPPQVSTKTVKQLKFAPGSTGTIGDMSVTNKGGVTTITQGANEEVKEEDEVTLDPNQDTETQEPHQVGPSTDDGFGEYEDGDVYENAKKKKDTPWAICHAQLGPRKNAKFESCVKQVKKSLKEGKNPSSLFIENKIMQLVETHLPPKITKQDLVKYLSEAEPATAPVKEPKTKPGTKTPPKPKPSHPGRNPNPKVNPSPKAMDAEEAKEKIIDTIMQILKK